MEAPTLDELYTLARYIRRTAKPGVREIAARTIAWAEHVWDTPNADGLKFFVTLEVGTDDNMLTELILRLSTSHLSDITLEMLANSKVLDETLSIQNYGGVGWWIIVAAGEGIGPYALV